MLVRKFLHANGYRYKLHDKSFPGKPDIILPKYKTLILIQDVAVGTEGQTAVNSEATNKQDFYLWKERSKKAFYLCPMADVHTKEIRSKNRQAI